MQRFWALDRLRALAVLAMIQGHCFTALLRPQALTGGVARLHGLIHGLTGPCFLFGAGLAFGMTTYARYPQHRQIGAALRARLRRYALLIVVGYALQLPGGSIWKAFSAQGAVLENVLRIGPLQHIALTLLLCQLGVLLIARPAHHALAALALGSAVLFSTRFVYTSGWPALLGPGFGSLLDDRFASQYPLFPWSCFVLFGVASAPLLRSAQPSRAWLAGLSALVAALLYGAFQAGAFHFDKQLFWRTHPSFVLFRLALVVLLLGLLQWPRDRQRVAPGPVVGTLAKHALVAYVAHLLLLYGTPLTPNLAFRHAQSLSLGQAGCVTVLILLATVAIVELWQWLSTRRPTGHRLVQAGLTLLGLVMLAR